MALRLSASHIVDRDNSDEDRFNDDRSERSSSEEDDEDLAWDDWASDSLAKVPCKSLFEDKTFDTVQEAMLYDETNHGFSLQATTARLGRLAFSSTMLNLELTLPSGLDPYKRIRLINWIRKEVKASLFLSARIV